MLDAQKSFLHAPTANSTVARRIKSTVYTISAVTLRHPVLHDFEMIHLCPHVVDGAMICPKTSTFEIVRLVV